MNDRLTIATQAMQGILIGSFSERPNCRPSPAKTAQLALAFADALLDEDRKTVKPAAPAA